VSESSRKCSFSRRSAARPLHTDKHGLARTDTAAPQTAAQSESRCPIRNPVNPVHFPLLRGLRGSACASSLLRVTACALLLLLLAMPALGGEVYLRGPDERGEGLLPAAPGVPPGLENLESFTVDVYAEDFPGFAGFQVELDLPAGFYMNYTISAPARNTTYFPEARDAYRAKTMGFYSIEYIDPFEPELGYADKTIPAEEEEEAVNPQNMVWTGHEGLTWLMTITVYYDATVGGNYTLDVYADNTEFADADEEALPYTIVTGSVTIESGGGDGLGGGGEEEEDFAEEMDGGGLLDSGGSVLDEEWADGIRSDGGAIYYVDGENGDDDTGEGSSSAPWATITKALTGRSDGDIIVVAGFSGEDPTVYDETVQIEDVAVILTGGFHNDNGTWTKDPETYRTIIDRDSAGRCVEIINCERGSAIYNFTLQNGQDDVKGAGVYIQDSGSSAAPVIIAGNVITDNAILSVADEYAPQFWQGGGMYCDNSEIVIAGNIVYNNSAGTVADRCDGGGIFLSDTIVHAFSDNVIQLNDGSGHGGGLTFESVSGPNGSPAVLNRNTIIENNAKEGGGLYASKSPLHFINNLIVLNIATATGGAIRASDQGEPVDLAFINCTIADNNGTPSSGLELRFWDLDSNCLIRNCIFWGNGFDPQNPDGSQITASISVGDNPSLLIEYSDIHYGEANIDINEEDELEWGDGNVTVLPDPLFVQENQQSRAEPGDYHLKQSPLSPCIDTATDDEAPADDLWQQLRPIDGDGDEKDEHDMGAFEWRPSPTEPDIPVSAGEIYYVEKDATGTGTSTSPYGSIVSALGAAGFGSIIIVAGGETALEYSESLTITEGVKLWGGYAHDGNGNWAPAIETHESVIDGNASGPCITITGTAVGPVISGFTITGGQATAGGGIHIEDSGSAVPVVICNNVIHSNIATGSGATGGGICCIEDEGESAVAIYQNFIMDNEVQATSGAGCGGGVYVQGATVVDFSRNVVMGNQVAPQQGGTSGHGGGVYFEDIAQPTGGLNVVNNLVVKNIVSTACASGEGGGFYVTFSEPTAIRFTNNTIADNDANASTTADGGGLYHTKAQAVVVNSIIWRNMIKGEHVDTSGSQISIDGGSVDVSYSDVEGGEAKVATANGGTTEWDENLDAQPRFLCDYVPLEYDGDYRLRNYASRLEDTSQCIDYGTVVGAPLIDIRGQERPVPPSEKVDVGAFQMQDADHIRLLEGDAILDLKTNILDLIYIRNRLNQSVATGDNWQANVNGDANINILDLLFTRNRLNQTCVNQYEAE